jgi:hypothetical protein
MRQPRGTRRTRGLRPKGFKGFKGIRRKGGAFALIGDSGMEVPGAGFEEMVETSLGKFQSRSNWQNFGHQSTADRNMPSYPS